MSNNGQDFAPFPAVPQTPEGGRVSYLAAKFYGYCALGLAGVTLGEHLANAPVPATRDSLIATVAAGVGSATSAVAATVHNRNR
jgi:hypothetical protein